MQQAGVEHPPGLFDAPVVKRVAKSRTQAEASQVQPARLVGRAAAAGFAMALELFPQAAQDRGRPAFTGPSTVVNWRGRAAAAASPTKTARRCSTAALTRPAIGRQGIGGEGGCPVAAAATGGDGRQAP